MPGTARGAVRRKVGIRSGIALASLGKEVAPVTAIEPGSRVIVRTARGEKLERRAITGVEPGDTFPVVWVCKEQAWEAAMKEQVTPEGMPWPADAVELAERAAA